MTTGHESLEDYVARAPEDPFADPFYQNTIPSALGENPWWGKRDYDAARRIGLLGVYAAGVKSQSDGPARATRSR